MVDIPRDRYPPPGPVPIRERREGGAALPDQKAADNWRDNRRPSLTPEQLEHVQETLFADLRIQNADKLFAAVIDDVQSRERRAQQPPIHDGKPSAPAKSTAELLAEMAAGFDEVSRIVARWRAEPLKPVVPSGVGDLACRLVSEADRLVRQQLGLAPSREVASPDRCGQPAPGLQDSPEARRS